MKLKSLLNVLKKHNAEINEESGVVKRYKAKVGNKNLRFLVDTFSPENVSSVVCFAGEDKTDSRVDYFPNHYYDRLIQVKDFLAK